MRLIYEKGSIHCHCVVWSEKYGMSFLDFQPCVTVMGVMKSWDNILVLEFILEKSFGVESRGGARNFPTGADSSNKGAKIWFLGYYKC